MPLAYRFQRHPLQMTADFRHSLVVAFAYPQQVLEPFLPPGLVLDTYNGFGFLAIALVDTQHLRPLGLPHCAGMNACLTGYRIFTRLAASPSFRGLKILRSDTDRWLIQVGGNLLTHYGYHLSKIEVSERSQQLRWAIQTRDHSADFEVTCDRSIHPAAPPAGSPFKNWREARRFAGPLPYTFDYERETHSIIRIEGKRKHWTPQPVEVSIKRCAFLEQPVFQGARPVLANAFFVPGVAYQWERGVRIRVQTEEQPQCLPSCA